MQIGRPIQTVEDRIRKGLLIPPSLPVITQAPPPPSDLSEGAKEIWRDTYALFLSVPGLLTTMDGPAIESYVRCRELLARIDRELRGCLYRNERPAGLLTARMSLTTIILKYETGFGMMAAAGRDRLPKVKHITQVSEGTIASILAMREEEEEDNDKDKIADDVA